MYVYTYSGPHRKKNVYNLLISIKKWFLMVYNVQCIILQSDVNVKYDKSRLEQHSRSKLSFAP